MSFSDGSCCDEAQKAAGAHCAQLARHPNSLSQIMNSILEQLPSTSYTSLIIRQNKRSDISTAIQTLLSLISSQFQLLMSTSHLNDLIHISFQKMNFGLVQLLEDGVSAFSHVLNQIKLSTFFLLVLWSSSALSALRFYFSTNAAHFRCISKAPSF